MIVNTALSFIGCALRFTFGINTDGINTDLSSYNVYLILNHQKKFS